MLSHKNLYYCQYVFVLDSLAACVHVVDRSAVAKCYIIGCYQKPNLKKYPETSDQSFKVKDIRLSNNLSSMCIDKSNVLFISDKGRGEIVVVCKTAPAKSVVCSKIHILNVENCLSLCSTGELIAALIRDPHKCDVIKLLSVTIPSSEKKTFQIQIDYKVVSCINSEFEAKSLFAVSGSAKCFGEWSSDSKVNFYSCSKKKWEKTSTPLTSSTIPCTDGSNTLFLLNTSNKLNSYKLKVNVTGIEVSDLNGTVALCDPVYCFYQWNKVTYIIKKKAVNVYILEEHGPLQLGLDFCCAVKDFYDAISYFPPHTKHVQNLTLQQCIDIGSNLQNLLESMQKGAECRFPTRHSFAGAEGIPFTETIGCVIETVDSWRALKKRLDFFDAEMANNIYSHAVTNESLVEHSFGFTKKKGQGHALSMEEYVQCKRNHAIDFLLRMCDLPFSQYVKTKVHDKGYQDLQEQGKLKLSMSEITEIFQQSSPQDMDAGEIADDDASLLKKAFLLSKSVPRQSSCNKWRAAASQQPNVGKKVLPGKAVKRVT